MAIENVVHKHRLGEEPSDAVFWRSKSPEERLAAVEQIRMEYHQWQLDAEPRLQRVLKVTRQTQS